MKHILTPTAMLLAPLAALAQKAQAAAIATVGDQLWIFTVCTLVNNKDQQGKHHICDFATGGSCMTPAEVAFELGVPNLLFIRAKDIPPLPRTKPERAATSFDQ